MTTKSADEYLAALADALAISETRYDQACRSYASLGAWLHRPESTVLRYDPQIYVQGSFRLGTAIRPLNDEEEYDVDSVCELRLLGTGDLSQKALKKLVGDEIKAYRIAQNMVKPVTEGKRCWVLSYSDGAQFHMDIVPAVPNNSRQKLLLEAYGLDTRFSETAIVITDVRSPVYDYISDDWQRSNPKGYAKWFQLRMGPIFERKRRAIAESVRASVEEIPEYRVRTPLQSAIMILKRHRDGMFVDRYDERPISVIITTLAAHAYNGEEKISDALYAILANMDRFIEHDGQNCIIRNPSDPLENFADKWPTHPERQNAFFEWLAQARHDFGQLAQQVERRRLVESIAPRMGAIAEKAAARMDPPSGSMLRPAASAAIIGTGAASAPAFPNTRREPTSPQGLRLIWWAEQPGCAQSERNAIGDLAERSPWLAGVEMRLVGTQLAFDFDLEIGERRIPLTLVYPDFFPDAAPSILARDRELLSGHQYGPSGELCLEHRPDNWTADITGAMMIESAHRLLAGEDETGRPAPADHRTTRAQRMRYSAFRFLFSRDTLSGLGMLAEGEVAEGEMQEQDVAGTYVAQLSRIGPEDAPLWRETKKRGGDVRSFRAVLVRVPTGGGRASKDFDELKALLWTNGHPALATDLKDGTDLVGVLLFDGQRIHVPMVFGEPGARKLISYDAVFAEADGVRLDPGYELLKSAKVAIVGCGSVGSKVAVQLARSGVCSFVLVDGDVLSAGNLVRNELDWRSVGVHKAPALGARLMEVNADCTFTARTNPLGGQESGAMAAATMAAIEACDLIVDATADPNVFNLCAAIARRAEKPMCWAQVFGGGAGGIVVRLRPGLDPTPLTTRHRIEAWYAEQGVDWPDDGSAKPYEDTSAEGIPMIADDADVTVIASHLSRFAIDLLARPGATTFPYPAYVIGLSDRWLFTAPFDVRPIDLGASDAWGVEPGSGDIEALKGLLADLTAKKTDAG